MNFNIKERLGWQPPQADFFRPFTHRINPPLDLSQLRLDLLEGDERRGLQTPTTGFCTLALRYKGREGAVTSLGEREADLVVLQVQGAKNKVSYRVSSGIDWVRLFAHQVISIAGQSSLPFQRVVMPAPYAIEGLLEEVIRGRETVDTKYIRFATQAGLRFSQDEQAFIRDIK